MTLAQGLSLYLVLNALVAAALLGVLASARIARLARRKLAAGAQLELAYASLVLVAGVAAAYPLMPKQDLFPPAARIWAAPSMKSLADEAASHDARGYLSLAMTERSPMIGAGGVALAWIAIAAGLLLVGGASLSRDVASLVRLRRRSHLVRRIGRVSILTNDEISVPFSYWMSGVAFVVVPSALLGHRDLRLAIAHELQHHRQRDTLWAYGAWALRLVCILNPAAHLLARRISELQEFACDEALIGRNKAEPKAYARCLVEVAQTAIRRRQRPASATGLTFLVESNLLRRRIETMFQQEKVHHGRFTKFATGLAMACLMAATAYASQGLVQDRRVSLQQAEQMAAAARLSGSSFPIVVNDLVLKQLNRFIGTPEGREQMRKALSRMETYRPVVEAKLREYNAPTELMAVPLIESGYVNRPPNEAKPHWGAGLWMFIASTARNFGLKVDDTTDERLDVEIETDAAMRYLTANKLLFKDWHLSLLAYNLGENAVQKAITVTKTRDAWSIVRAGYENDKAYLPAVMAAILIMKNPASVQ